MFSSAMWRTFTIREVMALLNFTKRQPAAPVARRAFGRFFADVSKAVEPSQNQVGWEAPRGWH